MTLTSTAKTCFTTLLFCGALSAYADDTTAVYFAKQAGVVAGAAQACGQPVSLMIMRVGEIINALAVNPMDNTYATAAFQKAQQDAQANMVQSQNVSCAQVISDFNRLPLLQPDYQTTVLQPMLASAPPKTPAPPTSAPLTTTGSANINPQAPPPTQNYVSNTPPTNPATVPPINPAYNASNTPQAPAENAQQATEVAKLQLAQQLAQMAQTLVTNNQTQIYAGPGTPSANNPAFNPQLNEQLYGVGANNPLYTGAPLVPPPSPPAAGK